ncbi:hypothetical protein [Antrihabitans cavernicola]|uniref:Uncharacterized protein n=1 Tax=Antrihabitans cavernicola TaxID=2495913 RepID=A0A5A7S6N6_9NOCA|nr:hypothetical protein [Spelaeibacter cavernicola]KAA0016560.1 hypothetical protein FOY51_26065 [Spelaeibacter cavernicola]
MIVDACGREFRFRFDPSYRLAARLFGIRDDSAVVRVGAGELCARFGPWTVRTPLRNIAAVSLTGPYAFVKTVGPAHLSFGDRGLTFASNNTRGVFVEFVDPIRGIDPFGLVRHPNLTMTVAEPAELVTLLDAR